MHYYSEYLRGSAHVHMSESILANVGQGRILRLAAARAEMSTLTFKSPPRVKTDQNRATCAAEKAKKELMHMTQWKNSVGGYSDDEVYNVWVVEEKITVKEKRAYAK